MTHAIRKVARSSPSSVSSTDTAMRSVAAIGRSLLGDAGIAVLGGAEADAEAVDGAAMRGELDILEHEDERGALLMITLQRPVERGAALWIGFRHRRRYPR